MDRYDRYEKYERIEEKLKFCWTVIKFITPGILMLLLGTLFVYVIDHL